MLKVWESDHFKEVFKSHSRQTARDDKSRVVHDMFQDSEDLEVTPKQADIVRSKVFNFHGVRSMLITPLNTKSGQISEMCELKIRHCK